MQLEGFLYQACSILGKENVFTDDASIQRYGRTTLPSAPQPVAITSPSTTEEVIALVNAARTHNVPLYPISRGKNWGYGDACPVQEGHVIIDLGRMNRIIEVNSDLAYAVIEPGVTQFQLFEFLRENNIQLWFDCSGAGPQASIVGNTLERGFGHTPYGDHFLNTAGMEVVLGDGRLLRTGYGHYTNATSTHVFKWGIGPYLDGLFSQSNFGIVTRMGVWLMKRPESFRAFFFSVPNDADLQLVIERMRPLRLQGTIRSTVHIANAIRVVSSYNRYPWEETKGRTPLPDEIMKKMCSQGRFGAWNITGALYGTKSEVKANIREIKAAFRGLAHVQFVSDRLMTVGDIFRNTLKKLGILEHLQGMIISLKEVIRLLQGEPTELFLHGTLWRAKGTEHPASLDPLDNNAGIMWISPILPMTADHATKLLDIISPVFNKFGFEPLITISLITERAMVCVTTISYDREDPDEGQKAMKCYNELFEKVISAGYIPYRCGNQSMKKLGLTSEVYWDVVNDLKKTLDPGGILSKGHYQPY